MAQWRERLTFEKMQNAADFVMSTGYCRKTPMLKHVEHCLTLPDSLKSCKIFLKMENMQIGGCFKMRGVINQLNNVKNDCKNGEKPNLLTNSSGNYGKCFSIVARRMDFKATVVMPDSAPKDRVELIKSNGCTVEIVPMSEMLGTVKNLELADPNARNLDPADDYDLIEAYSGIAFEIVEEIPDPDVVLIPCGGGGLMSGIAAGLRAKCSHRNDLKIYGVEPVTSCVMYECFKQKKVVDMPNAESIATGLCAPYGGKITYPVSRDCADDMLLVTDMEIMQALRALHSLGLVIEPSGAAGLAALLSGKVPINGKDKNIVVVISGANISLEDFQLLLRD